MAIRLKERLLRAKERFGLAYEARQLPRKPFSIISDDCWGGQVYRHHKLPYLSPTVGLQVMHTDYISFIQNLQQPDFLDFKEEALTNKYPTIRNPYALLLCVHYESAKRAIEAFKRRYHRMVWENLYFKIDFGKPWYSAADVDAWNQMRLPRSIALVYPKLHKRGVPINHVHNAVTVENWRRDGSKMYFASRRHFDLMRFLSTGAITSSDLCDALVYKSCVDVWWLNDKLRPKQANNIDFAEKLDELLDSDSDSAPAPYEAELK